MFVNAFIGRPEQPGDTELSAVLGPSRAWWDQLLEGFSSDGWVTGREWHSYSVKAGWALRLQHQKRNIVYLSPGEGVFQASFVFGDGALKAIAAAQFPPSLRDLISGSKKYAEGTGVRLEVKDAGAVEIARKLAAIKLRN